MLSLFESQKIANAFAPATSMATAKMIITRISEEQLNTPLSVVATSAQGNVIMINSLSSLLAEISSGIMAPSTAFLCGLIQCPEELQKLVAGILSASNMPPSTIALMEYVPRRVAEWASLRRAIDIPTLSQMSQSSSQISKWIFHGLFSDAIDVEKRYLALEAVSCPEKYWCPIIGEFLCETALPISRNLSEQLQVLVARWSFEENTYIVMGDTSFVPKGWPLKILP